MIMKLKYAIGFILIGLASISHATYYTSLGLVRPTVTVTSDSMTGSAEPALVEGTLGISLYDDFLFAEGRLALGFSEGDFPAGTRSIDVNYIFTADLLAELPITNNLSVYGLVGANGIFMDYTIRVINALALNQEESDGGPVTGWGIRYRWNDWAWIDLGYRHFYDDQLDFRFTDPLGLKISGWTTAFEARF